MLRQTPDDSPPIDKRSEPMKDKETVVIGKIFVESECNSRSVERKKSEPMKEIEMVVKDKRLVVTNS